MSPWALRYAEGMGAATMNALFLGAALIFLEQLNLDVHDDLEEWMDIAAGAWLVLSPFVLGFAQIGAAAINVVIVIASWALSPLDRKIASWWDGDLAHH